MSAIVGAVALSADAPSLRGHVDRMLSRLGQAYGGDAFAETARRIDTPGLALARLSHGLDAHAFHAAADGLTAFQMGELLGGGAPTDHAEQAALLAERYRREGPERFADGLDGSFAAAVFDPAAQRLVLATDVMANLTFYQARLGDVLLFASETKALFAVDELPCRPRDPMVLSLLVNGELINQQTLFDGVDPMPPGVVDIIALGSGGVRRHAYWQYQIDDAPPRRSRAGALDALCAVLASATGERTAWGTPGFLLSGGSDTRTILAFLPKPQAVRAVTYTARAEADRHPLGDVAIARRLAALRGMPHEIVPYAGDDVLKLVAWTTAETDAEATFVREGIWDEVRRAAGSPYLLIGDECFSCAAGSVARETMLEFIGLRDLSRCPSLWPYVRGDRFEAFCELTSAEISQLIACTEGRPANNVLDERLHSQHAFHFHNPKRRMLYRMGLQARRPLLARQVLDFNRALPMRLRKGKRLALDAMARNAPDVAALPRARDTETVDYARAFRQLERQGGQVTRFIFDDNPLLSEYLDADAVNDLVRRVTSEQSPARKRRPRLSDFIPPQARRVLAAFARKHLKMRSPYLTHPSEQLLRIVRVAAACRHVHHRCQGSPNVE